MYQNVNFRPALNCEEVFQRSSPTNCTVYCGGLSNTDDENVIRRAFSSFGRIVDVRVVLGDQNRGKGYAFVKYDNKESACRAIVAVNGTKIGIGPNSVKCSWGKETHAMNRYCRGLTKCA